MNETKKGCTERVGRLMEAMEERAWKNRSSDWLKQEMFPKYSEKFPCDIGDKYPDKPVIIRRAMAIGQMLDTLANPEVSKQTQTGTFVIREGELIVGIIAMGSLGLGKVFPNYLSGEEKRVATITLKTEMALFGHDTVNYESLVKKGLKEMINRCREKMEDIDSRLEHYSRLTGFCANLKADANRASGLFKKETGLEESLEKIAVKEDEKLGRRIKTYDKEIDVLFNRLKVTFEKKDRADHIPVLGKLHQKLLEKKNILHSKRDFYEAVKISCRGVIDYARKFAGLAEEMAEQETDATRKQELKEIARVCDKVPAEPAGTFHEALQSIYFFHLALHSSMNQLSLGRLDQVLRPFYNPAQRQKQLELFECFLIKCAERLILDSQTFVEQDHIDFASSLLTMPVELDQWAEANEFLQNIIIGGLTPDGKDAVNDISFLVLEAFQNTGLYTPTLNARLHRGHFNGKGEPGRYLQEVARTILKTGNGMPVLGNDDVLVHALKVSGVPEEEARDYVIDGCWEPLLNGRCDWTFRMLNMLTALECALNEGAALSSSPVLLRGKKVSYHTPPPPDRNTSSGFDTLKKNLTTHIRFFTDQAALSIYKLYLIDQAINPTPLYSTLLEGCLETGRDKTWGGAKYELGGIIASGIPETVNTLAAIKKWVYDEGEFEISQVKEALRYGFDASGDKQKQKDFNKIKVKFQSESPKFGDNDKEVNEIMKWFLDRYYQCAQESRQLAEEIFLTETEPGKEKKITSLRALAGYSGPSLKEEFGADFDIKFTVGIGTFELFTLMGMGNAASADRDRAGDPLARNFAPMAGSTDKPPAHLLSSFKEFGLNRFAGGAVTDICLEEKELDKDEDRALEQIQAIIEHFYKNNGNMITLTISDREKLEHIYHLCESYRCGDEEARKAINRYRHFNVRVAGYQAPFVTLSKQQQEIYINRPVSIKPG